MKNWEYDLSTEALADLGISAETTEAARPLILCDPRGQCFFHDRRESEIQAVRHLLNRRGTQGWELVQFDGHNGVVHCVWKREVSKNER